MITYETWPFRTFQQRSSGDNEQWWQHCYIPSPVAGVIGNVPQWTLLAGDAGTGKSIALRALQRERSDTIFFINYPATRWPGAQHAPRAEKSSHFPQMLASAAFALRDYLAKQPQTGQQLTMFEVEFLHWLFTTFIGPRAFARLRRYLPDQIQEEARRLTPSADFTQATDVLMVQTQIDELVGVVEILGFSHIVFTVDLTFPGTAIEKESLANLFGWLELTHHPNFAVIAAVPQTLLYDGHVLNRARGRARSLYLTWTHASCQQIAQQHIKQATHNRITLVDLATEKLLVSCADLIEREYSHPNPRGWVAIAEALLYVWHLTDRNQPLTPNKKDLVISAFYTRHMPLIVDRQAHGVWRGPQFIRLDEQPLLFLRLLYRRRGHPINWSDQELRDLAGSKDNVYSIARRTRLAIEPFPESPIYLINQRGEGGYWLENLQER